MCRLKDVDSVWVFGPRDGQRRPQGTRQLAGVHRAETVWILVPRHEEDEPSERERPDLDPRRRDVPPDPPKPLPALLRRQVFG